MPWGHFGCSLWLNSALLHCTQNTQPTAHFRDHKSQGFDGDAGSTFGRGLNTRKGFIGGGVLLRVGVN